MKHKTLSLLLGVILLWSLPAAAQRTETTLNDGWQFSKGHLNDVKSWENVRVPHDWAIYGPFDMSMVGGRGEKK